MNDEDTQPGDRIAQLFSEVKAIRLHLQGGPTEDFSDDVSAEVKISRTGNHVLFKTHGAFWSKLFVLAWNAASNTRRFKFIAGIGLGQTAIIWVAQLAQHWLALHVHK